MTWGRTLKEALKCKGLPVKFKKWRSMAEDRTGGVEIADVIEPIKHSRPVKLVQ